jgi:predicted DNA-binding transcriptional regulator AlpA
MHVSAHNNAETSVVTDVNTVKVLNRRDAVAHLGVSARTFERIEAAGDGPAKTRLSEGRIGYRVSDLETWLDARRIGAA